MVSNSLQFQKMYCVSRTELRRHNRAVYSAKLFSMGVMVQLRKERLLFRYSIRLFAAGVFPMLLRVQGNPTG